MQWCRQISTFSPISGLQGRRLEDALKGGGRVAGFNSGEWNLERVHHVRQLHSRQRNSVKSFFPMNKLSGRCLELAWRIETMGFCLF